ncbi:MAG: hypothetical protein U5K27_05875 [Desulfotignum sp.]|nr:hypothetical protein [Desulfotignum sp.]
MFSIEVDVYGVGDSAGEYHPILLTNQGDEELTGIEFGQTRLDYDTDINNSFDPAPPVTSDTPLSINIDLHKVGRDNDGGDLFIGGKHTEGIPDFHVDVLGEEDKPSNLGTITSNSGYLENVFISTHADYVDGLGVEDVGVASLTVRSGFGGGLDLVDADDFLGDLTLGSDTAINNLVTLTAMGGGDITFNGVNTGNTNNVVSTGAGADVITITDANNLQVSTDGGSDIIDLIVAGASKVDAGAGNDTVELTGGGTARVDGGAGDDEIKGGDVSITSNAGAGNDVTYVDNTGDMAASLFDLNALRQADEDGTPSFGFLFDRTVTVTVNGDQGINTQLAAQFTDGFEAEAVIGAANFDRLTTKADLIAAIQAAVENSNVLSSLVDVDDNGIITSKIDGDNISVEIHIGDSDWTTKDVATLQSEYRAVQGDSTLEVADDYAEISSAQVLAGGSDSEAVNSNTVTLSAGVDTVVLSTQVDAVDTLVFDGDFGTAYVVNFTEGEDVLDFSAYLDGQFSPTGSEASVVDIPVTSESDSELSANEINIQTFDGNDDVEEFDGLNAGNLLDLIDFSTEQYSNTSSNIELVNGEGSAIVMIQNDENLGEYKVFNVSFDGTDDDFELSDSDISMIGTVDFGADIADSVDNGELVPRLVLEMTTMMMMTMTP